MGAYFKLGNFAINTATLPMLHLGNTFDPTIYDEGYLKNYEEREKTGIGQALIRHRWRFVLGHLHESDVKTSPRESLVLDIGGGAGGFARAAPARVTCRMFDVNPHAPSDYNPQEFNSRKFDAVTMWDVIEHAEAPNIMLSQCRDVLRDDGWLFLSTPALDGSPLQLPRWRHFKPGEHLNLWSALGMWTYLEQFGLLVKEANFNESWLRQGDGQSCDRERNIVSFAAHY